MMAPDILCEWTLPRGDRARIRRAGPGDAEAVRSLYLRTYGDRYGLPEVADRERTARALQDPYYTWLVAECQGEVVGSVVFVQDPYHRLGKTFGGVVAEGFRGQHIMPHMIEEGHRRFLAPDGPCDLLYAVVRTFVPLSFHRELKELGYVDVGIFPNVRKVREYETHGLKIRPGPTFMPLRRPRPHLIPQVKTLYDIARSRLELEEPLVEELHLGPPPPGRLELRPFHPWEVVGGIEAQREAARREGRLEFGFFPLHEPNLLLADLTGTVQAFIYYQPLDGHSSLLGLVTGGLDRVEALLSVAGVCEQMGVKYLELLVPAYDPLLQAQAWQAGFLPCAYFPGARLAEDGRREDYVITSRTFVPLHFRGLKLTEDVKPYLLEYFKIYASFLWEELMDA
ncbi:MAG TPA: hypothetical protein VNO81_01710 [Candidatus Nitrosotenuis sp.]|jgi:hypothetical protein|nr:hypothetical protein [Candidatus Nitrosotenuis sp.]